MMRTSITLAIGGFVVLFCATSASAQNHLSPDLSVYSDDALGYIPAVVSPAIALLKDAYSDDVRVRVIEHSFILGDIAVGLKGDRNSYRVFALKSDLRSSKAVLKCEKPINAEVAKKIIDVWRAMLLRTSYEESHAASVKNNIIVHDGVSYHFALARYPASPKFGPPILSHVTYEGMEGQTFSPDTGSESGALVHIADRMQEFCEAKDNESAKQIDQAADELLHRLRSDRLK